MKKKDYIIEFNKQQSGLNHADYQINDEFLKEVGGEEVVSHADVVVDMDLVRSTNMYELEFHLHGTARLTCDVCLEEFDMPLDSYFSLIIKISESEQYDDDEIVYVTPATIDFDLTQYLYDSFMLSLPVKKVCSMSGNKECNPEVLKKLKESEAGEEEESGDHNDPRWDKLKGLFNKDEK